MWIFCSNYGKKLVYLKPHDSVQRPRVRRQGLIIFLCIFWNYSGVLHDRLLEMSFMVTPYVKYPYVNKNYSGNSFDIRSDRYLHKAVTQPTQRSVSRSKKVKEPSPDKPHQKFNPRQINEVDMKLLW